MQQANSHSWTNSMRLTNANDAGRSSVALACEDDAWCADLVVEVVEDDWSHDQSNTLSNQLHQTHMLGQTYMLDQDGSRIKLAALLQHTTMWFLQQRPHKTRSELPNSTTPTGAQVKAVSLA